MNEQIRSGVREVVTEHLGFSVGDTEMLISSGLIDSLSILQLISKLEQRLSVAIPTDRVQPEDFESVDIILETLERVVPE